MGAGNDSVALDASAGVGGPARGLPGRAAGRTAPGDGKPTALRSSDGESNICWYLMGQRSSDRQSMQGGVRT